MKKIMAIFLVSLLGFLGCSGSDDTTSTTSTFTGQATPVAPWAIIETPTPTYQWTPVSGVTQYHLIVHDTNQASTTQDTSETAVIDVWYTAEEAGCASEDSLCMVTPDIEVFGENEFKVQACAYDECGLWSETLRYEVAPPASSGAPRFTDNGDYTVTDNATGLMWNQYGDIVVSINSRWSGGMNCDSANGVFNNLTLAGYTDWRLPTLSELNSIHDELHFAWSEGTGSSAFVIGKNYTRYWPLSEGDLQSQDPDVTFYVMGLYEGWFKMWCHEMPGHGNGTYAMAVRTICGIPGHPQCKDPVVQ